MLTIAIATFFALALMGSLLTIAMMFHAYRDKIKAVIMAELGENVTVTSGISQRGPVPATRAYRTNARRHSFQSVPMRAAA